MPFVWVWKYNANICQQCFEISQVTIDCFAKSSKVFYYIFFLCSGVPLFEAAWGTCLQCLLNNLAVVFIALHKESINQHKLPKKETKSIIFFFRMSLITSLKQLLTEIMKVRMSLRSCFLTFTALSLHKLKDVFCQWHLVHRLLIAFLSFIFLSTKVGNLLTSLT